MFRNIFTTQLYFRKLDPIFGREESFGMNENFFKRVYKYLSAVTSNLFVTSKNEFSNSSNSRIQSAALKS